MKGLHNHRNIGKTEIQGIFEYWNQTLSLTHGTHFDDDQRLTTNMGRKTFCTLAELYTGSFIRSSFSCESVLRKADSRHGSHDLLHDGGSVHWEFLVI